MSRTIADLQEATIIDDQDEILFYQNSTKRTKKVKRGNFFRSRGIVFEGKVVNPETNEELWDEMGYNETIAKLATASVHGSQNSASGSVQIYYRNAVNPNILNPVPTPAITNPSPANGDIWYITNGNYKAFVYNSSTSVWERSTKSLLQLDANSNVSGLVKVGDTLAKNFVMVADNFEITNSAGAISGVPFAVRNYSAVFTGSIAASGTDGTATLTVTAVTSGPIRLNMVLTGSGVPDGPNTPIIKAFLTGTGSVGTYIISPFSSSVSSTTITGTVQGVRITEAIIETVDIGKATAGFLSSQAIELPNENSYIQSKSFIEEWVTNKQYKDIKTTPSDQTRVRIKQTTGIYAGAYKVYKVKTGQTHTSSSVNKPGSGASWTTYWDEVNNTGDISTRTDIQGFRIVGSGQIQLSDAIIDGDIWAKTGHFGNVKDSVRIDSKGLTIGDQGYIKSAGLGFNGTDGTSGAYGAFTNGPGFFLGNSSAESTPTPTSIYQFFIGNPTGNNLRWNGTNLLVNGSLVAESTSGSSGVGLTINSGFGIRYVNKTSVLTITGGDENGVQGGSQIDFVGVDATGPAGQANGQLILSAGYKKNPTSNAEASSFTDFYDGSIVFRTSYGSDINSGANLIGIKRLIIERNGTVTIGSQNDTVKSGAPNSGSGKLIVETSIEAPTYTSTSSKRFKKKIKNLKNGLETVSKLRPVVFDWKTKDLKNDIGLIAEEVNEVIPNLVGLNNKGDIVGIDYGKLTPILIQAIKELSAEINALKIKINHARSDKL
jgi:hypothetical protein